MSEQLPEEFMASRLRANGLPVARAVRRDDQERWELEMQPDEGGGIAIVHVPFSFTKYNLAGAIAEWVRDKIDPSPWTIAMFIEHVDRAREQHGGLSGRIVMTYRDWHALVDACLATGTSFATNTPSEHPPGAVGMLYGQWVSIGERTSFPCADGTDLANQ